jgi:hypothetical protein
VSETVAYHVFASVGIECEVLSSVFDRVIRIGLDPDPDPYSDRVINADATDLSGFDLPRGSFAYLQPPCQRFSSSTNGTGNPEDHPNLIGAARELGPELAEHYVIENVPQAPLRDPVVLEGPMFRMPIVYRRAFEASFPIEEPSTRLDSIPSEGVLGDQGTTGRQWVGPGEAWRLAKGYHGEWNMRPLKRHATPAPYLRYVLRHYFDASRD